MTWFDAILLGIIQGLTEFLPVSSSGHLVIAQHFIPGFEQPGVLFDVMLHLGTLLSVTLYFYEDIRGLSLAIFKKGESEGRGMVVLLLVGTIPTGIIAILFKDIFEQLFQSFTAVGFSLILTGVILYTASLIRGSLRAMRDMGWLDALLIGFVQGIAIVPGISRSGITISAGIFKRIKAVDAARFSFLLSIPAILGAVVLEAKGLKVLNPGDIWIYLLGTATAALSGYAAIAWLMDMLKRSGLRPFSYYCLVVGLLVVVTGISWR